MKNAYRKGMMMIFLLIALSVFFIWQNNDITITKKIYHNVKVPMDFNGYKILHISDLHNKKFGKKQYRILEKMKGLDADLIVVTGDLIDSRHTDILSAMEFIDGATQIAPVYYVPGNHEARLENYPEIVELLTNAGVIVLENQAILLKIKNSQLALIGSIDPSFYGDYRQEDVTEQFLEQIVEDYPEEFKILLSHRPELFSAYTKNNIDLVFSGHAHGGQFRLPFIGAFIAPDQGVLPKYTEGMYQDRNTTMVVSRGLGNSIIPIRIFNRPELVVVTLNTVKK